MASRRDAARGQEQPWREEHLARTTRRGAESRPPPHGSDQIGRKAVELVGPRWQIGDLPNPVLIPYIVSPSRTQHR